MDNIDNKEDSKENNIVINGNYSIIQGDKSKSNKCC